MAMRYLLTFFLLLSFGDRLFAEVETNPEIQVRLATASPLVPIYVGKIQTKDATFDSLYLNQLEKVLSYDLNHNGSTKICAYNSEIEQWLCAKQKPAPFDKSSSVCYAIRLQVDARSLSANIFPMQEGSAKAFSNILLTGDLNHDRRQIHKLADGIHKVLFDTDGIASHRILFAYQMKTKDNSSEWISEIWECDWDGANARQLTHDNSYSVTPVAMPYQKRYNNDRFLYVSYKLGQPKIYIGSLKGGIGRRLIDLRGNQLLPAISPQRDKIAFICDAGGRTDLFHAAD